MDGKGFIPIGAIPIMLGEKAMAGNLAHGIEEIRLVDASAFDLLIDHALAQIEIRVHGARGGAILSRQRCRELPADNSQDKG
jgi:hypothetical protein